MKNPEICIIAALSEDRIIGKDNKLPWRIPSDLKRFRELTVGHSIIMGRRTFESLGRPLPERVNIVVTSNDSFIAQGCLRSKSLEEAISLAKREEERVFIIGGGQIYEQAISMADRLYLTVVKGEFTGDTFFPDYSEFSKKISEEHGQSNGLEYTFLELIR